MKETINMSKKWTICRYLSDDDRIKGNLHETIIDGAGNVLPGKSEFDGNVMLNEGIAALLNLLTGAAETAYSNANAYLGVGESTTAASASQTGLQGATTTFKAMESGYPSISGQTVTFRSVFGGTDANNSWQEFTVVNAPTDAGDNLNRKVDDQGTKAAGQSWTLDLEITFS